jgi:hypothetical protein
MGICCLMAGLGVFLGSLCLLGWVLVTDRRCGLWLLAGASVFLALRQRTSISQLGKLGQVSMGLGNLSPAIRSLEMSFLGGFLKRGCGSMGSLRCLELYSS